MNWDDLRGHRDQIEMLRRSIERGRQAHAYLFAGSPGIGKSRFARIFAQAMFCERHADTELLTCEECSPCRQMNAGSHPDFFSIGCPEGKNEIPVSVFFGSPERRGQEGLIYNLSLRPMAGTRRIALIDDANRMNEEGANAMLKTLEEPPPHSMLILIAENLDALLPTIRSRCQLVRFSSLATDDITDLLLENELASTPEEATAAANMSDGSLHIAAQLLNPALRTLRLKLYESLATSGIRPIEVAKAMTSGIDQIGGDTNEQRRNAGWLIRFAQEFYRQVVLRLSGDGISQGAGSELVERFSSLLTAQGHMGIELAMELFDRCVLAESHISWNIAPTKTMESLFDDLARTIRNGLRPQR
ncbi:MAG: DNA polymerase III subunit delta' [Planctomycetota bacterium]|nr:DNA polymerase III subunit delta' [Planctomycetota bacterium]MDA1163746.1 DNA polymerase III subunit delta' [Planctomycetota bacterium]